jgi:hypothetical protein
MAATKGSFAPATVGTVSVLVTVLAKEFTTETVPVVALKPLFATSNTCARSDVVKNRAATLLRKIVRINAACAFISLLLTRPGVSRGVADASVLEQAT